MVNAFSFFSSSLHFVLTLKFSNYRINQEEQIMKMNPSLRKYQMSDNFTETPMQSKASPTESPNQLNRETFMIVYTCIIVVGTFCYVIRSFAFYRMCLRISINLHGMIFRGVSRAKMIFFNKNPSGRILNRFSGDITNIDAMLPNNIADVLDVSKIYKLYFKIQNSPIPSTIH